MSSDPETPEQKLARIQTHPQYRCIETPFGQRGSRMEGPTKGETFWVVPAGGGRYDLYGMNPDYATGEYVDTATLNDLQRFFVQVA